MRHFFRKLIKLIFYKIYRIIITDDDLISGIITNLRYRENEIRMISMRRSIKLMGEGVVFNGSSIVTRPSQVILGNNIHIQNNAYFETSAGLTICDNVYISENVTIFSKNYTNSALPVPPSESMPFLPVFIGRNAWVGPNVSIFPGVSIGEGAVIKMGAVVERNVEPFEIAGQSSAELKQGISDISCRVVDSDSGLKCHGNGEQGGTFENKLTGREKKDKLFFIVSTGRSGSMSIANMLTQHEKILCYHEANRQFIRLSTEYAHGNIHEDEVRRYLTEIYSKPGIFCGEKLVGDSNLKFGNVIGLLADILPDAKFIWLARNGIDFVSSAMNRDWFSEKKRSSQVRHQWSQYRLNGYKVGEFNAREWTDLCSFEKCCWYWSYWNRHIGDQFEKIDTNRKLFIRLENLRDQIPEVLDFLDVEPFPISIRKDNSTKYTKMSKGTLWGEKELAVFDNRCASMMKELGYN